MRSVWLWVAALPLAAIVLLVVVVFTGEDGAPPSVWTDGTRICDAPNGNPASLVGHQGLGSPGSATDRRTLLTSYRPAWKERVRCSLSERTWLLSGEVYVSRPYTPVAGSDVRDDADVIWWRCDLVK